MSSPLLSTKLFKKRTQNELKNDAESTPHRVEIAISINLHGWRIRDDVLCRQVCAPLDRAREWAHTFRQKASRRMRHPIFISFRGSKAHGDRHQKADAPAALRKDVKNRGNELCQVLCYQQNCPKNELKTNSNMTPKTLRERVRGLAGNPNRDFPRTRERDAPATAGETPAPHRRLSTQPFRLRKNRVAWRIFLVDHGTGR